MCSVWVCVLFRAPLSGPFEKETAIFHSPPLPARAMPIRLRWPWCFGASQDRLRIEKLDFAWRNRATHSAQSSSFKPPCRHRPPTGVPFRMPAGASQRTTQMPADFNGLLLWRFLDLSFKETLVQLRWVGPTTVGAKGKAGENVARTGKSLPRTVSFTRDRSSTSASGELLCRGLWRYTS